MPAGKGEGVGSRASILSVMPNAAPDRESSKIILKETLEHVLKMIQNKNVEKETSGKKYLLL